LQYDDALAAAERAAHRAGVAVCALRDTEAHAAVFQLFDRIWNLDPYNPPVTTEMLTALAHTGNFVVGSYQGPRLVGASVGFFAEPSRSTLYSHITGVAGETRGRGVGFALKLYQRAWAVDRGIRTIEWVFDPLVRRNAYLNLVKLGGRASRYVVDFYGDIHDDVNEGQGTDRLVVEWDLRAPEAPGRGGEPELVDHHAAVLLERGTDGRPRVTPPGDPVPKLALALVPDDIERMRREAADIAAEWRRASREVFTRALQGGAVITGFLRSGWYVLRRPTP
jgi:predicted GNAT superfamily acetyltransferase